MNEQRPEDDDIRPSIPRIGEEKARTITNLGALSSVGFMFVFAIIIGAGFGYLLDGWIGTSPWFFLIFFFLGLAAGMLNVYRMFFKLLK